MIGFARHRRLAATIVAFPIAALIAAGCGGTDYVDGPDSSTPDGEAPDATQGDGARGDGNESDGAPLDGTLLDGRVADGGLPDADAEGDGAREPDAEAGLDAEAGVDADAGIVAEAGADAEAGLDAQADAEAGLDADAEAAADADASDAGQELLGTAHTFAVLAGSTVTIAPVPPATETFITGDVGTSPNATAIGVFSAGQPVGQIHAGDPVSLQAEADLTTAYNTLLAKACPNVLTGSDLGTLGIALPPGVYCFSSSAALTGTLVLDAQNDPDAEWVFQIGTTLTTAATNGVVTIINGTPASGCHVYWAVGSSATLDTGAVFLGNVVASASITLQLGAVLSPGRALAQTGAVTLAGNTVSQELCP
jgi:hypothetical protein